MTETIQKTMIPSHALTDLDGNLIGDFDNFISVFSKVLKEITKEEPHLHTSNFNSVGIQETINEYRAVRHCYFGDVSSHDMVLNIHIKRFHGLAKQIGYKPIEIKSKTQ